MPTRIENASIISVDAAHSSAAYGQPELVRQRVSDRLVGLVVMTIIPAAFWIVVIGLAASTLGAPLSGSALLQIGSAIALFLLLVGAAITSRTS
ncbi:MAG: hypothetical protein KDJ37_11450 [Hyphomicrobiaceae bacterium]|nr:hypothetical protein [Hyphomicrobiaceae bacterium]